MNPEGYADSTADKAVARIDREDREKRRQLSVECLLRKTAFEHGFRVVEIQIRKKGRRMDRQILAQYADLKDEAQELQKRVFRVQAELENMGDGTVTDLVQSGDIVTGRKKITGKSTAYVRKKAALHRLKAQNELMEADLLDAQSEAESFINSISDSRLRRIVRMRVIDCESWARIANAMGGGNTDDSVRKMFDRFIQKQ